jgi:hypothetical protein
MNELVQKLRNIPGVKLNPPATPEEIEAAEAKLGTQLPDEVREFYKLANGAKLLECLDICSLDHAVDYFQYVTGGLTEMMLPIVDEYESNPICLFYNGPLRGYVAHFFHDGDSHVKWRNFQALLEEIITAFHSGELRNADKFRGDLAATPRNEKDVEAGRQMLVFAKRFESHTAESPFMHGFAFDLLGEEQVPEIAAFFEHEDMFVSRAARDRLREINRPNAKAVLERYREEEKELVRYCAQLLRAVGHQVTVVDESNIRIDPGPVWLNTEALMSERKRSDFDDWVRGIGKRQRPS